MPEGALIVGAEGHAARAAELLDGAGVAVAGTVTSLAATGAINPGQVLVLADPEDAESPAQRVAAALQAAPGAHVVVVASSATRARIRQAFDSGAFGYVVADRLRGTLAATVAAVGAGQICLPPESGVRTVGAVLSTREKQVLAMVVLGLTNAEIASKLFVTESTVKSHLTSSFGKLGVRSRNEATRLILDPESSVGVGILTIPSSE